MAFDDLDLQFEDEAESKKKKSDAVQTSVDLEFDLPENGQVKSHSNLQKPASLCGAPPVVAPVTNMTDVRAAQAAVKKASVPSTTSRTNAPAASAKVAGSSALKEMAHDFESQSVVQMREELRRTQFEAEVRVAVAEYKVELLSELLSDTKLMQHQIEQLLVRINAKHPDMKQEVLIIKKILADFTAKKRK